MRQDAQGIAFALNADMVQQVLSEHLSAGKVAHVSHGLTCHEVVTAEDGDDRVQVVVDEVAAKSPAASAGLRKGDVLRKVESRQRDEPLRRGAGLLGLQAPATRSRWRCSAAARRRRPS